MRETCVDFQFQGNYMLFRETMALHLVLRVEKKIHVIEQPLPPAPEPVAEPDIVAQWTGFKQSLADNDQRLKDGGLMLPSVASYKSVVKKR
ncbi:hypothetical protein Tco_1058339 [Tanacetum coccineum]|uniref:Uncharacterized protein n=1 Tax=Tanacetum coccineum TaxID=301880 RepID=A0ABQ5H9S0_9ASTR